MNYTPNHHLPQWNESDPIRMEDFNSAMSSIDSGISTAQTAAQTAQAAADSVRSAADAAQAAAQIAQSAANSASDHASRYFYRTGTYLGTGKDNYIELGFEPLFVIISRVEANGEHDLGMVSYGSTGGRCRTFDKGFIVLAPDSAHPEYPNLNINQKRYEFIAFN